MGFGSLFKKSDDKQKPASPAPSSNPYAGPSSAGPSSASNPYAAPSPNPYAQPSPPTQHQPYQQHNSAQFQDNQRASQSSYGAPSQSSYGGLPSGPRPGGLPARGSQGPGAWGSDRDSQGAPPPSYTSVAGAPSTNTSPSVASTVFSRRAPNSNQTSPSLYSGAPSPAFGSNTSSPAIGTGYPSEKYGAADGIGRNRFETPAASRYDQYAPGPSQRPGGYGDLDRAREELFSGYNRNQQTGPSLAQSQSPHFQPGNFPDRQHMTEEELEVAQLNDKIGAEQLAYEDTLGRTLARAEEAEARVDQAHESLSRQEETLDKARIHMAHTHNLNEDAKDSTTRLKDANRFLFKPGFSSSKHDELAAQRAERNVNYLRQVDDLRSEHQARRQQMPLMPEDRGTRVLAPQAASQSSIGKYTFEDDDGTQAARVAEWGEKEDRLVAITGRMKSKAVLFGERIDESNKRLEDMGDSATRARDDIVRNQAKMMRAAGIKDYH